MHVVIITVLALAAQTVGSSPVPYAPLRVYAGSWRVTRGNAPAGSKPELLANDCAPVGRFFACQQSVNGIPGGLLVFVPTSQPGHFYTQTIMPEGRATGRDELQITGDVWTFSSRRSEGGKTTLYRTVNTFTGRNRIHFESAQSLNGSDWTTQSSSDAVRVGAGAQTAR
jgi:hypothetical protein